MANKQNKIDIICDYWVDLITDEMRKNGIKIREYAEAQYLKAFRYNLEEYLEFFYPKFPNSPMLQLSCIGSPNYILRGIMKDSKLNPDFLQGKILEMEITYKDVKLHNRKTNTCEILYSRKNHVENSERQI